MGSAKDEMMEQESQGFSNPPDWNVCADLFPRHAMIRSFIQNHGSKGVCHFIGKHTTVVSLKDLLQFIYDELRKYYEDPANQCGYSSANDEDEFKGTGLHKDFGYILPNTRAVRDTNEVFDEELFWTESEELDEIIKSSIFDNFWVEKDPYGEYTFRGDDISMGKI